MKNCEEIKRRAVKLEKAYTPTIPDHKETLSFCDGLSCDDSMNESLTEVTGVRLGSADFSI